MSIENPMKPETIGAPDIQQESMCEKRKHHDRYVHYSHEMTEDTAEASARVLIRAVPLAYGLLLGGLINDLVLGGVLGGMLSIGLDLQMRDQSIFAPWIKPLLKRD